MLEKIQELAAAYTTKEITPNTILRSDLGLSSFDLVSLLSEVEETFDIKIKDEDIMSLNTVQDLIDYIENNSK